jgi:hypothetical protein
VFSLLFSGVSLLLYKRCEYLGRVLAKPQKNLIVLHPSDVGLDVIGQWQAHGLTGLDTELALM